MAQWMSAGQMVREIAAFRASLTDLRGTRARNTPTVERANEVCAALKDAAGPAAAALIANGPPRGRRERRYARDPLDIEVTGDGGAAVLPSSHWNGEAEPMIRPGAFPQRVWRPAPSELRVDRTDAAGARHGVRITLGEAEVYAALGTLSGASKSEPVTPDLRVEPGGRGMHATLRPTRAALRLRDAAINTIRRKRFRRK
ncbi:MAG: hypothetical protein ACJA1L_002292 [Paracoccaceae bacterium]